MYSQARGACCQSVPAHIQDSYSFMPLSPFVPFLQEAWKVQDYVCLTPPCWPCFLVIELKNTHA